MADPKPLAVVLLSGGMDSLVTAKLASDKYRVALFHLNYGQRTEEAELRAFKAIADWFGTTHALNAHTNFFRQIGGSALTDDAIAVPMGDPNRKEIPVTYVPFRNGLLLSMAAAWAEAIGAKRIFYGAVQSDSSGYPDCREAFVTAMGKAVKAGTKPKSGIEIEAPLISLDKEGIVRLGADYHLPFELTWSCYERNDIHCGLCDSCLLRKKGFAAAGIADPTRYAPDRTIRDAEDQRKIERLKILLKALVPKPEAA
jgi:7-cyano-7-deazaguanine synthase